MAKPECEHGPYPGFEPQLKRGWVDDYLVRHVGPRCPTFMLHKRRQCEAQGARRFPHYCRNHSEPIEIAKQKLCLKCKSERKAERQAKAAEARAAKAAIRKQRQAERQAERETKRAAHRGQAKAGRKRQAKPRTLESVVYSGQLLEPGEMERILGDDYEQLAVLRAELKRGHEEIAAGDQSGASRISEALSDFTLYLNVAILEDLALPT